METAMVDDQDQAYFVRRAAAARAMEAQSTNPAIKEVHSAMAGEYERRARGEALRDIKRF